MHLNSIQKRYIYSSIVYLILDIQPRTCICTTTFSLTLSVLTIPDYTFSLGSLYNSLVGFAFRSRKQEQFSEAPLSDGVRKGTEYSALHGSGRRSKLKSTDQNFLENTFFYSNPENCLASLGVCVVTDTHMETSVWSLESLFISASTLNLTVWIL